MNRIESIKKKAIPVLRKYKITKAGIFGSYARGDYKKNSDIDMLVQPPKGIGFGFFNNRYGKECRYRKSNIV